MTPKFSTVANFVTRVTGMVYKNMDNDTSFKVISNRWLLRNEE